MFCVYKIYYFVPKLHLTQYGSAALNIKQTPLDDFIHSKYQQALI